MSNRYKMLLAILLIVFVALFFCTKTLKIDYEDGILGIYNRPFNDYVVFYPQHQDDEVLWGGSAIVEAIDQKGEDNVYVVLVSDGSGVNVLNKGKYKDLSRKEKAKLRNNEFKAALRDLGIKEENTIILSDIDNIEGTHFELMRSVALDFEKRFKSVTHVAHSYRYDNHPMHIKNGKVIQKLYSDKKIKDAMYFLKPEYIKKVKSVNRIIYVSDNEEDYKRVKQACMEYKIIDEKLSRHGIGYISAHSYFDKLLRDKNLTSVLHLPITNKE